MAGADAEQLRPILETLLSLESLRTNTGDKLVEAHFRQTHLLAHLDDYRLIRVVGRGGMGIVFEGLEEAIGRRVAVKVLDHRYVANQRALKRFLREARATACLHHTNILPIFATGADQGTHYYVMPFVDGINLASLVDSLRSRVASGHRTYLTDLDLTVPANVLSVGADNVDEPMVEPSGRIDQSNITRDGSYYRRIAEIAVQICDALRHAYQHGIIHRDIKPSNVMIDTNRHIWVMDYGLVHLVDDENLTETGELLGTLRYLAPERLRGIHTIQGDLFGLGMVMYELISLTTAFDASSRQHLQHQIMTSQPIFISKIDRQVPRDLATIVTKAISPDPLKRYAEPGELLTDLELFLEDRPIASRRARWTEHTWSWCRRNPAVASLLSCIVVLLITIATVSAYSAQSLRRERNVAQHTEQERRQILCQSLIDEAESRFI
jgi:serine/threonine protein kinase